MSKNMNVRMQTSNDDTSTSIQHNCAVNTIVAGVMLSLSSFAIDTI